jgi:hypothetical protein
VPAIYITVLHDPAIAFGNTTTLELMAHPHATYGGITEAELDRNTGIMKDQLQPPTAIEVLFVQIEAGVAFALSGDDPKSEPVILQMAYNNNAKTGRFDTACHDWRNMPPVDTSWGAFKMHFKTADKDLRLLSTTGSSGYHGAAHIPTNTDTVLLAAMHTKFMAAEDALDAALTHHNITLTASVTTSATNVSGMTPTTSAPPANSARS